MVKRQKIYTREFKVEAVQLVKSSGKPMSQIARELGISDSALYQWCKHLDDHGEQAFPGSGHQSAKARGNPSPEAGTGRHTPGARYFKKSSQHLLTGVQMKYQFIATYQQDYPISTMCRVLQVEVGWLLCLAAANSQSAEPGRCRAD